MFKGKISTNAVSVTANTNIPLTVVWNTNTATSYDSSTNQILLNVPGYFDINATFVITGATAGVVTLQMLADGVKVPEAIASATSTGSDAITLNIADTVKTTATSYGSTANISFQLSQAVDIDAAIVTVEQRK